MADYNDFVFEEFYDFEKKCFSVDKVRIFYDPALKMKHIRSW